MNISAKPLGILRIAGKKKFIQVSDQFTRQKIELPEDEFFQQIPNLEKERDVIYITGASGSGKSFYTKNYVEEYRKLFKKRDVFLFSALSEDSTLDELPYIKRIALTQEFLEDEGVSAEDFENSLVIFDDCDCIVDKAMKKKVSSILNSILQTGRHFKTSLIYTSHSATMGNETKLILSECHSITIFPSGCGNRTLKYLLDSYLGLDRKQIKYIKDVPSRWVTIAKTYPMIIFSEHDAIVAKAIA